MSTQLIQDPEAKFKLTAVKETDCPTALIRGVTEYMTELQLDFPGGRRQTLNDVIETWAAPEQDADYPAMVVRLWGKGNYEGKSLTPTIDPGQQLEDGRYAVETAEFTSNLVAELHCTDDKDRNTIGSAIEDALQPLVHMAGFKLLLPHYHSQVAHFELLDVEYIDTEEETRRRLRISRYTLKGHVAQIRLATIAQLQLVKILDTVS